jgi:4'-phosphopantetheinyl transferase
MEDAVDVWRAPLRLRAAEVERLWALLSDDEAARVARFRFPEHRAAWVVARATLRRVLGAYVRRPPASLRFGAGSHGKPLLAGGPHFNLSHSGNVALIAVGGARRVGVDVEQVREIEHDRLAGRFFSPAENEQLAALSQAERHGAFFACWTRKEAVVKAQGVGLSLDLDAFDVSVTGPARLLATRPDSAEAHRWSLADVDAGPGYAAAVAAEGDGWHVVVRDVEGAA